MAEKVSGEDFTCLAMDSDLLQAYQETHYRVYGPAPFILQVGMANDDLIALHRAFGVESSGFITACNPLSQLLGESANAQLQRALADDLRQRGVVFIEGLGQHPENQWPGEASFLVLGLSLAEAKGLGHRYRQNALIWCGVDGVPQLVCLR